MDTTAESSDTAAAAAAATTASEAMPSDPLALAVDPALDPILSVSADVNNLSAALAAQPPVASNADIQPTQVLHSSSNDNSAYAFQTYLRHDSEEQHHWDDVCRAYRQYATFAMAQWANHQYRVQSLSDSQRMHLPAGLSMGTVEYQERWQAYKDAAIRNQFCLDCILRHAGYPILAPPPNASAAAAANHAATANGNGNNNNNNTADDPMQVPDESPSRQSGSSASSASVHQANGAAHNNASNHNGSGNSNNTNDNANNTNASATSSSDSSMSKVSSVLKSLVRDWSHEGKAERDMAYLPLIQQLQHYVPIRRGPAGQQPQAGQSQHAHTQSSPPKICVPGAGLGRLAWEICALGYSVQGNEFSLYMLLASDYILNGAVGTFEQRQSTSAGTDAAGQGTFQPSLRISPYLLESRNVHAPMDPCRVIAIPDVDPYSFCSAGTSITATAAPAPSVDDTMETGVQDAAVSDDTDFPALDEEPGMQTEEFEAATTTEPAAAAFEETEDANQVSYEPDFSMAAGEFVSIYSTPRECEQWDAVVACFFLDASPCVIEYLQVIHHMLKPGGYLLSLGPLLWHWSGPAMRPDDSSVHHYRQRYNYLDPKYLTSVDMCWEDVKEILQIVGFELVLEKTGVPALYTPDSRSMMNMNYQCINFVARKVLR
jgi:N2227-like protein